MSLNDRSWSNSQIRSIGEVPKSFHSRGFDFSKSSPRKDFVHYDKRHSFEYDTVIDYEKIK
jgi:hypothetical protein